ncbi:MAG TPA: pectate lyase [Rhodocyclaceae bacterium]|nr:pectate lyase [Rhodocyclaceae bacterium]
MFSSRLWALLALSVGLSACGGGGGSDASPTSSGSGSSVSSSIASSAASSVASSIASSSASSASSTSTSSVSSSSASVASSSSSSSNTSSSSSSTSSAASPLTPANASTGAYVDTALQITFDAAPTVGTSGFVYVYKSDGTLVDKLSLNAFTNGSWVDDATASTPALTPALLSTYNTTTLSALAAANTEVDKIGNVSTLTQFRWVLYRPITVSGKTATIKLHDNKLSPSTSYYVLMDSGVLNGTISSTAFNGISSATAWTFTTKADPSSTTSVTVDDDGAADFRTVQGALNWMLKNCGGTNNSTSCGTSAKTITIKNGTYNEMLFARSLNNLTIQGESRDGVVVQYNMYNDFNPGTGGSATLTTVTGTNLLSGKAQKAKDGLYRAYLGGGRPVMLVEGSDLLSLTTFTLNNSHVKDVNYNNQAETIYFNGSGRLAATYMNFLSAQDTVQVKGYSWFYKSLIAGDVDFIWGSPYAALFENSEIRTVADTADATSGGYVVQSRAYYGYPGFVFLNSALTAASGVPTGATYLARSGGAYCNSNGANNGTGAYTKGVALYCDAISYVNTTMGAHVASAGWYTNPIPNLPFSSAQFNSSFATQAALYVDLGSTGNTNTGTTGIYAANGWFEYNSKDVSNASVTSHGTDGTYSQQMTSAVYNSSYASRDLIFKSYNSNAGWSPTTPPACSSAACNTSR